MHYGLKSLTKWQNFRGLAHIDTQSHYRSWNMGLPVSYNYEQAKEMSTLEHRGGQGDVWVLQRALPSVCLTTYQFNTALCSCSHFIPASERITISSPALIQCLLCLLPFLFVPLEFILSVKKIENIIKLEIRGWSIHLSILVTYQIHLEETNWFNFPLFVSGLILCISVNCGALLFEGILFHMSWWTSRENPLSAQLNLVVRGEMKAWGEND